MKKLSLLALVAAAFMVSCQGAAGDKSATTGEQEVAAQSGVTYTVDSTSTLTWKGYHKGGFEPRFGTLLATGTVSVDNDVITGGSFVIDMNSITTDEAAVDVKTSGGKTAADLDGHLKSADFFETEKYPTAKFEITSVAPFDAAKDKSVLEGATNIISGNLTIKDKTVNVTFPAKVSISNSGLDVVSNFTINRQDWGLVYGTEGDAKDWMISPEVDIAFDIKAKK